MREKGYCWRLGNLANLGTGEIGDGGHGHLFERA
jgi:hypothetical protein